VVAGNTETSQAIVNALFGAVGVVACSQATMNNFIFGDATRQYYETICGGAGAGPGFDGTAAVHTHMTNTPHDRPRGAGVALSGGGWRRLRSVAAPAAPDAGRAAMARCGESDFSSR